MGEYLIQFTAIGLIIYTIVPTVLARFCGLGVISRLPLKDRVIITFDDGPDPRYTPRVLDILRAAGVKACFFVIGEKARRHPEIIEKIISDGHEIGNHGLKHRVPWLLGPYETFREMKETSRIIEEITGSPPSVFRPPWGLFNPFSYLSCFLMKHKFVMWTFMSWDWTVRATSESIEKLLGKKLTGGSILVFHDSDTEPGASEGSPEKVISALPGILSGLKEKGYKVSLLGDCPGRPGSRPEPLWVRLWRTWDRFFRHVLNIRDVTESDGTPTIFRVSARRYYGPRVYLPCGEILLPGQKVCELHLNNDYLFQRLAGESNPGKIGIRVARELRRSLPVLARHIFNDPLFRDAGFIVGITTLYRGTASMGFVPEKIPPSPLRTFLSFYQGLILRMYHPAGSSRLMGKGDMTPRIIVMSKSALFSRHLETGSSLP